ncbi:MAG: AMP-dependent synthetase/ligase, partial [bacterium]
MLRRTVAKFPTKVARKYSVGKTHHELTYSEFYGRVFEYAQGLAELGLKRGDHVVILGESSLEWALVDWACLSLGVVTVPIYPTLPADQAQHIANDCQATWAFVQDDKLAAKLTGVSCKLFEAIPATTGMTREAWEAMTDQVVLDDLATIIYTSGTTGVPKGAMLAHRAFVELCDGIMKTIPIDDKDTFLSFLPLSHVYERFAGHILPMACGATIVMTASAATIAGDLQKQHPTIMTCVPRLLDAFKGRVIDAVRKDPPIRQKLFALALAQGIKKGKGEFAPLYWLTDKLVGSKIRARLGPSMRFFVSGGAALPTHVSEFLIAFGVTVLQGYGLTETCAASSLNRPDNNRPWTAGEPLEGVEMKIAPDGEILIKGSGLMTGYYNMPEATAAAIDSEGWFHTGDIGEFDGPSLKITDRKKDLLVLGNGKNVAPQAVENRLKESEWINEAVVFGDGMEYCCALIVPEFERLKTWLNRSSATTQEIAQAPEVKDLIKKEIDNANKQMADFERVKRHVIVGAPFTVEGGELTPSLKVRKRVVKE